MLRKGFALALSIAVPFAALCAPPAHAHVDDHDRAHHDSDHHHGGAVHAHYAPHSSQPAVHEHDEHDGSDSTRSTHLEESEDAGQAVFLQLFVAVAAQTFVLPAVVPPVLTLTPPPDTGFSPQFHVVHGHDPPFLTSLPARAPPTFLS